MKMSRVIAVIIAFLAVCWIVSGLVIPSSGDSKKAQPLDISTNLSSSTEDIDVFKVRVRRLNAENFRDSISVTGRSRASKRVDVKSETTGQLRALFKEEGQYVKKGELLAKIDLKDRQARVREAHERVHQYRIEYNAAEKLAARGFNSQIKLSQSRANLENAKARLKETQSALSDTRINAPLSGVVITQMVEVGDYLSLGMPVFTIVDLNLIEFVGYVSERKVQDLKLGRVAIVELLNHEKIEGRVSYIAPVADLQTRTFEVVVTAQNRDHKIKEGMTAKIYIPSAHKTAHKISPSSLSLNDEGAIGVKIVDSSNKVEFKAVSILSDQTDAMWVDGLPEQVRLITVGQDFVVEGQSVDPVESKSEGLL